MNPDNQAPFSPQPPQPQPQPLQPQVPVYPNAPGAPQPPQPPQSVGPQFQSPQFQPQPQPLSQPSQFQPQPQPMTPLAQPAAEQPVPEVPRYIVPQGQALPAKSSVAYPWVPVTGPDTSQYSLADQQPPVPDAPAPPSLPLRPADATSMGQFPQYGDPMAVLPPLGGYQAPGTPQQPQPQQTLQRPAPRQSVPERKHGLHKWVIVALLGIGVAACIGLAILLMNRGSHAPQKAPAKTAGQQTIKPVVYNNATVAQLVKTNQLNSQTVAKLDKNNTFYSAFRAAAQQPLVRTKQDAYFTKKQNDKRGSDYTFYDVTMQYGNKNYAYHEDDYRKIGTWRLRCQGGQLFMFDATKSTAAAQGWHRASDDSPCTLASVSAHANDGLNTGGLNGTQSDAFVQSLNKSGAVRVNALELTGGKAPVFKFDVTVMPQKTKSGYKGMGAFGDALRAAGVSGDTYSYFGAAGDGLRLAYYVDPTTMLPVYAVMHSTPSYDKSGKPVSPGSWSHRFVEYTFPLQLTPPVLTDSAPIAFSAWGDH